jgi:hypothetical protein
MENKEKIKLLKEKANMLEKKLENTEHEDFPELLRELRNIENLIYRLENPINHGKYQGISALTIHKECSTFTSKHS